VQLPLQHWAEPLQVALSAVQLAAVEHLPAAVSHWRLQQSVATAHELPGPLQVDTDEVQVCETGSHEAEQHWAFALQDAPATVQTTLAPPVPGVCPPAPPFPVVITLLELFPQPHQTSDVNSAAEASHLSDAPTAIRRSMSGESPQRRQPAQGRAHTMAAVRSRKAP
jgi:hypothetical protein